MAPSTVRAVIVDNSPTIRKLLAGGAAGRSVDVVGTGADGAEAVELCERLQPDVLSLDLVMPGSDGFDALRELRRRRLLVPVVVVSSVSVDGGDVAMRLLEEGAVEVLLKPAPGAPLGEFFDRYAQTLQTAARANVEALWKVDAREVARVTDVRDGERRVVVIAASTGGPRALQVIAETLPDALGLGTLVVQHMPRIFTHQFATRLDRSSSLHFTEARDGDAIRRDVALVAPGARHLRVPRSGQVAVTEDPPVGGLRPRADLTIGDVAARYGSRVLLVVLTGMGSDGLQGARDVRASGGLVFAESAETALIDGMPFAVAGAGLADEVLPLGDMAAAICEAAG